MVPVSGGGAPTVTVASLGDGWYAVRCGDRTQHRVSVRPDVLRRVAAEGEDPEQTVRRAFAFLLEREPPESILRSFALEDIARYFPEFWEAMRTR